MTELVNRSKNRAPLSDVSVYPQRLQQKQGMDGDNRRRSVERSRDTVDIKMLWFCGGVVQYATTEQAVGINTQIMHKNQQPDELRLSPSTSSPPS